MKKSLFLLIPLALSLACQAVTGGSSQPAGAPPEPVLTIRGTTAPHGITSVRLHKQDGDLAAQLAAEAQTAAALGQQPVVYLDANW